MKSFLGQKAKMLRKGTLPSLTITSSSPYAAEKKTCRIFERSPQESKFVKAHRNSICGNIPKLPKYHSTNDANLRLIKSTYYVQVIFNTNYGNDSIIGCSEIDILDSSYKALLITSIELESRQHETVSIPHTSSKGINPQFENLVNSNLIKDSQMDEWSTEWTGQPLKFLIKLESDKPPTSIRIWNSREKDHRGVKDVQIFANKQFIASSQIPEGFGKIIVFNQKDDVADTVFKAPYHSHQHMQTHVINDQYGDVPVYLTKKIKIDLLDTFEPSPVVGLKLIEIITFSGKKVTIDDLQTFDVINIKIDSAPQRLIPKSQQMQFIEETWFAHKIPETIPQIVLTLNEPMSIALIKIHNVSKTPNSPNCGVKKAQIFFDNQRVFIGKLKRSNEQTTRPTRIWFVDVPEIKRNVSRLVREIETADV